MYVPNQALPVARVNAWLLGFVLGAIASVVFLAWLPLWLKSLLLAAAVVGIGRRPLGLLAVAGFLVGIATVSLSLVLGLLPSSGTYVAIAASVLVAGVALTALTSWGPGAHWKNASDDRTEGQRYGRR